MHGIGTTHHRLTTNWGHTSLQDGSGKISLRMLQSYANKYGGETLGMEDLRQIFKDFKTSDENYITKNEFLMFFSKMSKTITNKDFASMIQEMSA